MKDSRNKTIEVGKEVAYFAEKPNGTMLMRVGTVENVGEELVRIKCKATGDTVEKNGNQIIVLEK